MARVVENDHRAKTSACRANPPDGVSALRAEQLRLAADRAHVVVLRHRPEARPLGRLRGSQLRYRTALAQRREALVQRLGQRLVPSWMSSTVRRRAAASHHGTAWDPTRATAGGRIMSSTPWRSARRDPLALVLRRPRMSLTVIIASASTADRGRVQHPRLHLDAEVAEAGPAGDVGEVGVVEDVARHDRPTWTAGLPAQPHRSRRGRTSRQPA